MLAQKQKQTLTVSEPELLFWLYMQTEESTPLVLSRQSGMKKEAVSRYLKQLCEKGLVEKEKRPQDERSCALSLTECRKMHFGKTTNQSSSRCMSFKGTWERILNNCSA